MQGPNDPHLDRLIQNQLRNGSAQPALAAGQVWQRAGNCPTCGAPIWFCAAAPATETPPHATYSCACASLAAERAKDDLSSFLKLRAVRESIASGGLVEP